MEIMEMARLLGFYSHSDTGKVWYLMFICPEVLFFYANKHPTKEEI